ncbi:MAG TPA: hypothetical protein VHK06_00680 [Candidatus Limnocylindria bacterium]|nr:hypothetical protein [Candidatus Limnocylindria bacterium]
MSRRIELLVGVMLLAIGLLILAADSIVSWFSELALDDRLLAYWPILLLGLSIVFLLPAIFGRQHRRLRAGMVIPGAILAVVGAALLWTSLNDRWSAWSYLWTSVPFSLGLGMYAAGWIADAPAFKWIGSGLAAGAVVAYLVFATAFGGPGFRLVAAVAILALGAALTVGGLAERLSRKSPA